MNASSINPFFHNIDLSTTTGIKTFNNGIIGLDEEEHHEASSIQKRSGRKVWLVEQRCFN